MKAYKLVAVSSVAILALAGCSSAPTEGTGSKGNGGQPNSIVVAGYGGTFSDAQRAAYYEPFTAETGIGIVEAETSIATLQSQVSTGNVQWDVMVLSTTDLAQGTANDLFESVDGVVDPESFVVDTVTDYGIGLNFSSNVLAWNTANIGDSTPESWSDFWDLEKYPGKRAVPSWGPDAQLFEFALLADGVAVKDLYPLDIDRALKKLEELRDDMIVYDSNAQGLQLVTGGQTNLALLPNGRVELAARASMPIDFTFNEGALVVDWAAIPKGAPNAEAAKEFLRFATEVPQQQAFLTQIPYSGTNVGSLEGLSPSVLKTLPTSEEAMKVQFRPDAAYYAEHGSELIKAWQGFLYG
ncbi:MAG: ABC transporter substrate-binding protein [Mycobacterium sp.]